MLGRGAQKTFKTVTFFTCTSGGVAAPKILPRPGGRGCAKNPADRKLSLSFRFAFHLDIENPLGGGTLAEFRSSLYVHVQRVFYPNNGIF
jgi:hypothetical protein